MLALVYRYIVTLSRFSSVAVAGLDMPRSNKPKNRAFFGVVNSWCTRPILLLLLLLYYSKKNRARVVVRAAAE